MLYRTLLRLLPRTRRARYGDDMALVFADLRAEARRNGGRRAAPMLWLREVAGMFRFSVREVGGRLAGVFERLSLGWSGGRWNLPAEVRWSWRGIRARGWSAVFIVGLLAVVLAANTLVFSAADSLLFNTLPYREADRLVLTSMSDRTRLQALRSYSDLFESVQGYLHGSTYVTGDREPVMVDTVFLSAGTLEMLGITPRWGRSLVEADVQATDPPVAILDHDFAVDRFGSPAGAVGRLLETSGQPLSVVGVMPRGFRFPEGTTRIWRVLDYERYAGSGVIVSGFPGVWPIARLVPGVTLDDVEAAVIERQPDMKPRGDNRAVNPVRFGRPDDARRITLIALLGASICLLLTACANVASVELTSALRRARLHAVQRALGASRSSMVRVALLEGAWLLGAAGALATVLVVTGLDALVAGLPARLTSAGVNPIDLDWRTATFMAGAAALTWLVSSLPVMVRSARANLLDVLKSGDRSATTSRAGTMTRRLLTVAQVALAVLLLVGGLLYVRTYQSLLALETGFEEYGVLSIHVTVPPETSQGQLADVNSRLLASIEAQPGVLRASPFAPAPPGVGFAMMAKPEIDGVEVPGDAVALVYHVDRAFLEVLRVPLLAGRYLEDGDDWTAAVISETMARRFWGSVNPVGRRFSIGSGWPTFTVVGVVGHVRNDRDSREGPSSTNFAFYAPPPPNRGGGTINRPAPAATPPVNVPSSLRSRAAGVLARVDDPSRLGAIVNAARLDPRHRVEVEWLTDAYARRHAEPLMAAAIVGAFSVMAFAVSIAGIYGVMAFLVAGRTREIGIRMALGADRARVSRMVLGSSAGLVVAGAVLGCAGALLASRSIASQLFGVSPTDPATYVLVSGAVVLAALVATWHPARLAAGVDPATTLRSE